jgi:hypothetical protein
MQAIFIARGPAFARNVQIDSLKNVDIYHIACHILQLQPNTHANAGSIVNLSDLFRSSETSMSTSMKTAHFDSTSNILRLFMLMIIILSIFDYAHDYSAE